MSTTTDVLFNVPTIEEVGEANKATFDNLKKQLGFVPNLYASYAYSDTALNDYLAFNGRKTSLTNKEKEVVNLVTSQINTCDYCLAAHTAIGKMAGFNDDEIIAIRKNNITFNEKYSALAQFVTETVNNKGKASEGTVNALLDAGYTKENVVDTILLIGDKIISNYMNNTTQVPVDFPAAPALS